jgi:hypothetical protein
MMMYLLASKNFVLNDKKGRVPNERDPLIRMAEIYTMASDLPTDAAETILAFRTSTLLALSEVLPADLDTVPQAHHVRHSQTHSQT